MHKADLVPHSHFFGYVGAQGRPPQGISNQNSVMGPLPAPESWETTLSQELKNPEWKSLYKQTL